MTPAPDESTLSASIWAPLRTGPFRAVWLAALASNIGSWMQTVGAQWLLVGVPHAALYVSLVQTADMLPNLLLGMVGGTLADIFDRRRLLIAVESMLAVTCAALAALTLAHRMSPELLLIFTFLMGLGSVPEAPAFQAIVPDLVPRGQIPAASALSSVNVNLARAIGPAIAGIVIVRSSVGALFVTNTLTFVLFAVVIAAWRAPKRAAAGYREPFGAALRAGSNYVRYAPVVRRVMLRAALFLVPGSIIWALLPLIASERLGLGAGGYGVLLAAFGAGAIGGAFVLAPLRERWTANAIVVAGSAVFAAALVATALVRNELIVLLALLPAGVAWVGLLSGFNASLQLFLPEWVRARGLAIYQIVFYGAQALGALLWGAVANGFGLVPTFLAAAAVMLVGAGTIRLWPLIDTRGMDRSRAVHWEEPVVALTGDALGGPVVVHTTFTVAPEHEAQFLRAMRRVRLSRLRTGAIQWGLFRDAEHPHRFVELFLVATWEEHLQQHGERQTGADRRFDEEAKSFSDPPPKTTHYIGAEVGR